MEDRITLGHGSGGALTENLIKEFFFKYLKSAELAKLNDAAFINNKNGKLVLTTDSFVVSPLFFPGGDIGKLAVYGTCNDLAVMKAQPLFLSLAFIIEEGLEIKILEKILKSIKSAAKEAGVEIITGDTKVVEKGKGDGIFITSSGIGKVLEETTRKPQEDDLIIISGNIAEHGLAIISSRDDFDIKSSIKSDCGSLYPLVSQMLKATTDIPFIRDATRGGVAMVLNELAEKFNIGLEIEEEKIPLRGETKSFCDMLGFDPLALANEGTLVAVVPKEKSGRVLNNLKKILKGQNAAVIGRVTKDYKGKALLKTKLGGLRIIDKPSGEILPRIC